MEVIVQKQPEVIFAQLKSDNQPIIVQSICTSCQKNGKTTMLLTNIPFFKDIIVISFNCEECGNRNSNIQFGGKLAAQGVKIVFTATVAQDLSRQIVKSEFARITIPELDFEITPNNKGEITTLEGLFIRCINDLKEEQPVRKQNEPQVYNKIEKFLIQLEQICNGQRLPFNIIMDDPSGNSFIKNPYSPKLDPRLIFNHYKRTPQMLQSMGYSSENVNQQLQQLQNEDAHKLDFTAPFNQQSYLKTQTASFEVPCHSCGLIGQTKMCQTSIPYFSDLIIMSFHCEYCGISSTQSKTSGQVKEFGTKIVLQNPTLQDLKRDLFKSQTCGVQIPQLELQLDYGTLGGCLTTVEGLIEKISDHLSENNPFADSDQVFYARMKKLLDDLKDCRTGKKNFTLILVDPLGHSFMQNPKYPDLDLNVTVEHFTRTQDQNQFFGLLDMNVDHYK